MTICYFVENYHNRRCSVRMILFLKVILMSVIIKFHKVPNNVHCGDVVVGMRWPYRQIALLPPMLICLAWQVRVISAPCWAGKESSVLMLLHVESRVLQPDSGTVMYVQYNVIVKSKRLFSAEYWAPGNITNIWWTIKLLQLHSWNFLFNSLHKYLTHFMC